MLCPWVMASFLVFALLGCIRPPPAGPSPAERDAQVPPPLVALSPGLPTTTAAVLLRLGSAQDPSGQEGLAALTARVLRAGGAGPWASAALEAELHGLGATLEVRVEREWVAFVGEAPSAAGPALVELLGALLTQPRWEPAALEAERAAAQARLEALPTQPARLAEELLLLQLYAGHPYGHPVDGRLGVLPTLGLAELQGFYAAHYRRSLAQVGVLGPDAPALAARLAEALGALPAGRVEPHLPRPTPAPRGGVVLLAQGPGPGVSAALGLGVRATPDDPGLAARARLDGLALPQGPTHRLPACDAAWPRTQPCIGVGAGPWAPDEVPAALQALLAAAEDPPPRSSPALGAQEQLLRVLASRALAVRFGPPTPALPAADPLGAMWRPESLTLVLVAEDPAGLAQALFEDSGTSPVQATEPAPASAPGYPVPVDRWLLLPPEGLFQ